MKIAFFWTWEFSKNILDWILKYKDIDVSLVVSQPDKPVWRKRILEPTPVKKLALEKQISVLQPEKVIWNNDFFDKLKNLDFIVVVAYWKIVPKEVLDAPKYWCINIHGSILPLYRWASPIQEAIKNGDKKTWLTIMYMSEKMDEWDIINIEEVNIDKDDKTEDIFKKFENIWPDLLYTSLKWILENKLIRTAQNDDYATYCKKIIKENGEVFFAKESAEQIYNKHKAYYSWPWIYTFFNGNKLQICDCKLFTSPPMFHKDEWEVACLENKEIWVVCADKKVLILKKVKLEWKQETDIISFINWNRQFLNHRF